MALPHKQQVAHINSLQSELSYTAILRIKPDTIELARAQN
jgi:hypothetical protein